MNPLPLVPGLLDTAVLRDLHRATNAACLFAERMLKVGALRFSASSVLLVSCECADANDRELLDLLLEHNEVLSITATISRRALALVRALPTPTALDPSVALVAATALVHHLPVYTTDPARYANLPGVVAVRPY